MFELRDIDIHFGAVKALRGVNFGIAAGEVVALLGDNGAGKSTLLKIMAGAMRPTGGAIFREGRPVEFHTPRDAAAAGVQIVYQDLALIDAADVATNISLGREPVRRAPLGWLGLLDKKAMRRLAGEQLDVLEVSTIDSVTRSVETLSGGQRQAVALARAAIRITIDRARFLLLDEPTASLGYRQSRQVERPPIVVTIEPAVYSAKFQERCTSSISGNNFLPHHQLKIVLDRSRRHKYHLTLRTRPSRGPRSLRVSRARYYCHQPRDRVH